MMISPLSATSSRAPPPETFPCLFMHEPEWKKSINQLLINNNACAFWPECIFGFIIRMKRLLSLF